MFRHIAGIPQSWEEFLLLDPKIEYNVHSNIVINDGKSLACTVALLRQGHAHQIPQSTHYSLLWWSHAHLVWMDYMYMYMYM